VTSHYTAENQSEQL